MSDGSAQRSLVGTHDARRARARERHDRARRRRRRRRARCRRVSRANGGADRGRGRDDAQKHHQLAGEARCAVSYRLVLQSMSMCGAHAMANRRAFDHVCAPG